MDRATFEARPSILNEEVCRHSSKSGLIVSVSHGGMFLFDFSAIYPLCEDHCSNMAAELLGNRLEVMNAFLACLYSRLNCNMVAPQIMVVQPEHTIRKMNLDDKDAGFSGSRVHHLYMAADIGSYSTHWPLGFDYRIFMRQSNIPVEAIYDALELLCDLEESSKARQMNAMRMAVLLLRSARAYKDHAFDVSLLTSWAVIEQMINVLCRDEIDKGGIFTKDELENVLKKMELNSVSKKLKYLKKTGIITPEFYQKVDRVRVCRNGWAHQVQYIQEDDSNISFEVGIELFNKIAGTTLSIPMQLSIPF
jgi:hypothetical protein